uniref:Uncharacterized protein n=1 Tax=Mycena chlorophos TaxID=658473 RepID=A0ABQ0KXK7_MYCCL|nr:predicted protein [Mycena chlorophos]
MATNSFPVSFPRNEGPPLRGTKEPGMGQTPLYYLAWKVNPRSIIPGRSGKCFDGFRHDFVDKWNQNIRAKPAERKPPHPSLKLWLGGVDDENIYFVAANNNRDPATITEEDIQYAKDALPSFRPRAKVDIDSDTVFRWYRLVNKL